MEVCCTAEDLSAKLKEDSNNYRNLLEETHTKALLQNAIQTRRWEDYKKDNVELSDHLMSLRDKLSHEVMVPVGKRALMRGRLVHTNEIMVCLGDGWFAKQTAKQASEICKRRVQNCDEMLKKLKKEEELLNSRKLFPFESEAFSIGDQTQEIIEPYNEEEEKLWREKHRQKEKDYRKKLAELKKAPKTRIETEEDLWSRLDALDMQEELEDELNRMDEDMEGNEDDSDSDDETDEEMEPSEQNTLQRRVSFREEEMRIVFKHSDLPGFRLLSSSDVINSPSDIYAQYMKHKMPKSILKPSVATSHPPVHLVNETPQREVTLSNFTANHLPLAPEPANKAISDEVVERTPTVATAAAAERPVSRFKAARMTAKR